MARIVATTVTPTARNRGEAWVVIEGGEDEEGDEVVDSEDEEEEEEGMSAKVMLLNPWSDAAFVLALAATGAAEVDEFLRDPPPADAEHIAGLIQTSRFYKHKYTPSLDGYQELIEGGFDSAIEVRATSYEVSATILLTDDEGFFEPYVYNNPEKRQELKKFLFREKNH